MSHILFTYKNVVFLNFTWKKKFVAGIDGGGGGTGAPLSPFSTALLLRQLLLETKMVRHELVTCWLPVDYELVGYELVTCWLPVGYLLVLEKFYRTCTLQKWCHHSNRFLQYLDMIANKIRYKSLIDITFIECALIIEYLKSHLITPSSCFEERIWFWCFYYWF